LLNITDTFGKKVKDIVVQGTNVFPDSVRILNKEFNSEWLIGKYKANLTLYYGSEKNQVINPSITFYVFPLKIFIVVLIFILLIFLARKRLKKVLNAIIGK
jgi:hypothetical protein